MLQKLRICLLFICITGSIFGQKDKVKKADEEFDTYSYIDARKIYLKVVEDGYESAQVFKKLGDTYYFNSEYKEASIWYKRLLEKFPNEVEPIYKHRAAQSLKSIGAYEEANKIMGSYADAAQNSSIAESYQKNKYTLDSIIDFESKEYKVLNASNGLSSSDFGPSFFGNSIVYASTSKNTQGDKIHDWNGLPYLDLYVADLDENGLFSKSASLKGDINTPYHESSACFTKDGRTMYFTRNNYIDGKKKRGKNKLVSLKIYKATKSTNGSWGNVSELPFNSDSYAVAHPALNRDETRLYFSSDMPGTLGMSDIWYVEVLKNGSYGSPVNLGSRVNTEARESFPYLSDNNNLYFSSDGHVGLGGLDVFVISLNNPGTFKAVTNLKKPINTNQDDFGLIINEEKRFGYLSSNRNGNEGSKSDDIYRFAESCSTLIKGLVVDKDTKKILPGSRVMLLDKNNNVVSQTVADSKGSYNFDGISDCNNQYSVRATNSELDYQPDEKLINTPVGSSTLEVNLELTPPDCPVNDLGCRLDLQPIYFDFDKHNIRPDAEVELAKILSAMKEYPQLVIHIESHTDSRGNDRYNELLSDRRAKSTLEWLVKKGINRSRLSAKGYGESQLQNECSNGVKCSEKAHQLNRRSMFIIKN
ncbi:Peptidoglycan-associated lipoprotein [Flagellimonas maritima]|uniref:Peptidoglycan-associated lipoprotein n=1 Tax=Flagellimonas maritima TaxID=1383885 RepID=A0A2Z4LWS8_9FLAO|nr:OmpA family protein [Allomuricauda aurantiaca]AWX45964.1 Peptidoglycan-associated lipoprotein [Allomuricauda aurantiaca]